MNLLKMLNRKTKEEAEKLTPEQVFAMLEEQRESLDEKDLKDYFLSVMQVAERMRRARQTEGLRRLNFLAKVAVREAELVKRGYDSFIWKRKLDEILDPSDTSVKICELAEFTRPLPEEAVKIIEDTEDLFSAYFIMFTDYTGKEDRKRATIERNKDPILFGAFVEEDGQHNIDFGERMYPLFSWKDEYCELTLDELVAKYEASHDDELVNKLSIKELAETVETRLGEFNAMKDSEKDDE